MTDKQIIIDGVDVSKCKYIDIENFEKPICHCISQRNECEMPCEYNKDCYYKQLKRKEQECEELKEDRERWKSNFNGKVSAIEELLQQLDQFKVKNIKNSKTLTEIKEIAEIISLPMGTGKSGNRVILAKQILQKISEVENE